MTDTLTATSPLSEADNAAGCGCCKPPSIDLADEVQELQARRDAVERRLAGLQTGARP